jgi:Myb-like DNA-binding domain
MPRKQSNSSKSRRKSGSESYRRLAWTEAEDESLLQEVLQLRPGHKFTSTESLDPLEWDQVAKQMKNRTSKQCRERFSAAVNPSIDHSPFSQKETKQLRSLHEEFGAQWTIIANKMPGRTALQCRNAINALMRRKESSEIPYKGRNSPKKVHSSVAARVQPDRKARSKKRAKSFNVNETPRMYHERVEDEDNDEAMETPATSEHEAIEIGSIPSLRSARSSPDVHLDRSHASTLPFRCKGILITILSPHPPSPQDVPELDLWRNEIAEVLLNLSSSSGRFGSVSSLEK